LKMSGGASRAQVEAYSSDKASWVVSIPGRLTTAGMRQCSNSGPYWHNAIAMRFGCPYLTLGLDLPSVAPNTHRTQNRFSESLMAGNRYRMDRCRNHLTDEFDFRHATPSVVAGILCELVMLRLPVACSPLPGWRLSDMVLEYLRYTSFAASLAVACYAWLLCTSTPGSILIWLT
jgi:hypothetical protein